MPRSADAGPGIKWLGWRGGCPGLSKTLARWVLGGFWVEIMMARRSCTAPRSERRRLEAVTEAWWPAVQRPRWMRPLPPCDAALTGAS